MNAPIQNLSRRWLLSLTLLAVALLFAGAVALALGPSSIGLLEIGRALTGGGEGGDRTILLQVRLPRVLLAALVGAGLSGAGAAFQAILRNPLAEPYILGVSGGAALGAVLFTALAGADILGAPLGRPAAAFAGALLTTLVLFNLARARGRTGSMALLLVGVILNAFDSALILFLVSAGDPSRFQGVLFYLVGAMTSLPWTVLGWLSALVIGGLALLVLQGHRLNLFSMGEEVASHLGVEVERTLWTVVIAASLVTAAAVAFTGLVGFVGLIVPHALRASLGPDHRLLLPASILGGATFLVLADGIARVLVAPVEMPVGVITALVGGPFFLVLFLRRLREE